MIMRSGKKAIDKIYKRRDRYEIPDWQRLPVWGVSQKQLLIDSMLRDWKLPKFYLLKTSDEPEEYEVVDGQQRLLSIFEFFDNELALSAKSAKEFGGATYQKLPDKYTDVFDDYEIEYDEIEDATDAEVKEFFQRLQAGLPLTSSEKLNSVHSKLRDYLRRLTKHGIFQKVKASNKRYGHFDIVAKAAAIEIDGIEVGLRYDDLHAVFESQANFSDKSNVAKRLEGALDFLNTAFDGKTGLLRNRTIVQSLITLTARLMQSGKAGGQEKRIAGFVEVFVKELTCQVELGQNATDLDYIHFQKTVNANIKGSARIRQEILLRKLLAYDPVFVELLDPAGIAESGLVKTVAEDAAEIVEMIGRINAKYSAEKGTDLFKPTNKTALAQAKFGKPARSFENYKGLVDDLYFVFHEGVGNRLEGAMPASFTDMNALRTGVRHDVDHGKDGKVKAKRLKIGEVFKKYAGETTPESLAPERFVVAQANILGALKRDLKTIKW